MKAASTGCSARAAAGVTREGGIFSDRRTPTQRSDQVEVMGVEVKGFVGGERDRPSPVYGKGGRIYVGRPKNRHISSDLNKVSSRFHAKEAPQCRPCLGFPPPSGV